MSSEKPLKRRGFSPVERLLVVVDGSPNGRLALRLAGLLARSRGITTTVLHLGRETPQAAVKAAIAARGDWGPPPAHERRGVHLTLRTNALSAESAVAREAHKGYGLLVLGIEKTMAQHGGFDEEIAHVAAAFDGPLAIVSRAAGMSISLTNAASTSWSR